MLKKLIAAAAFAASLGVAPALADYTFFDASKVVKTVKSFGSGNTVIQGYAPMDSTGVAFGTPGNPISINCITGCSGGGGGGGAVFGPTAVGAPAANPPILIGGTVDGTATGAISAWKVLAGIGFINCANCSGSGISVGFGGAIGGVGTPGGFKDGSGNFQPLLGDVTNGQWVNIKASATIPVSLTSTTITGSVAVTGTFWQATQPVSIAGSVAVTGPLTDTQLRATAVPVSGTFFQATQPVSIAATVAVSGPLTDTQLRASAVPVSLTSTTITGSVTVAQASAASLNATVVGTGTFAVQASIASASAWGINTLGSTTSGQSGQLALGAVTTAAPTYTTAQSNALSLTTGGLLRVDGSGVTQPVSGTVAFSNSTIAVTNAGTFAVQLTGATNNINNISGTISLPSGASTGVAQGSTTSGQVGTLMQGAVTTANPTYTNAQTSPLSVDTSGGLRVSIIAGGGSGGTASSFAAAFPATGTAVGMSQGGNMVAFTGTSGNLNVQCANCSGSGASATDTTTFTAGASVFAPGGGFFQTTATNNALTNGQQGAWQMTANRAGFVNLRDTSGTAIGTSAAELFIGGRGTAGSAAGGVLSVQGVASMTPILTNPGTAANWGINTLGSTTSGQSGTLGLGAVTTAAPTYTTAQSNALSLTTAGALRVDGSGVTQPVSLTSTTITGTVAVTQSGSWSLAANQSVNISQINGVTPLMGNGITGTGSQRVTIASDNTAFTVNAAQSGTWNITNISGTVSLPTGAATAAKQPALGTAGAASTDVITVQGIASMTPLLANPGTAANWGINTLGSTTSGQSGQLALGAVTTGAPTYTTAQSNALSLTTAGDLRTVFSNTTIAVTQGTASSLNATVVGTGTFAVQAAQSGAWTVSGTGTAGSAASGVVTVQGIASMTPLLVNPGTAANFGVGATAAAVPANATYNGINIGGNLTGLTGLSLGTARAATVAIVDGSGNQVTTFGGSGGTSSNFGSAFPSAGTAAGFTNGTNLTAASVGAVANVAAATNFLNTLAVGQYNATPVTVTDTRYQSLQLDVNGYLKVNVTSATGLAQGSTTSGQSGSLVMCAVTTSAPTYTTAQTSPLSCDTSGNLRISGGGGGGGAVTMASGAVASGAYSSGSIASGAFASGAVSSGAYASGSLASGAVVDITNLSTPIAPNTATATKGILNGGQYNSTQATFTNGQQGALQISSRGAQYVAVGADGFNVTNAGTFAVQIAANSSVNMAQINGVTPLMGNGATGTGSQRVTIASDNTAFTVNPASATAPVSTMNSSSAAAGVTSAMAGVFDDVSPTAITENNFGFVRMSANRNQYTTIRDAAGNERGANVTAANALSIDNTSVGGTTILTGNGATGAGSQRVTIANDNSPVSGLGVGATASAPPANGNYLAAKSSGATGGLLAGLIQCDSTAIYDASTSGSTQLVALTASRTIYVCGYSLSTGGTATNVKLVYGTGTNCGTGSTNMTPAYQLGANSGIVDRGSFSQGLKTASANALCINASAANAVQAIVYYTVL